MSSSDDDDGTFGDGPAGGNVPESSYDISWDAIKSALPSLRTFLSAFGAIGAGTAAVLVGSDDSPGLLTDPQTFLKEEVYQLIEQWVVEFLIKPVLGFFIEAFRIVADSALFIAFGADRTLGYYDSLGLLDIPAFIVISLVDAIAPFGDSVLGIMSSVNAAIAGVAASAGISAPVIIPGLWLAWVAVFTYAAWTVVSAIDLPGVRAVPLLNRLLAPVRGALNWLQ